MGFNSAFKGLRKEGASFWSVLSKKPYPANVENMVSS